jgi:acetyltransferase
VVIRSLRPADRALWLELLGAMSWVTRYLRGARSVEDLEPEAIDRAVHLDPVNEVAMVGIAERGAAATMVGIARATQTDQGRWEFTLVVLDAFQHAGIGAGLMHALLEELRSRRGTLVVGEVLATNRRMLDFVRQLGFVVHDKEAHEITCRISLALGPEAPAGEH